MMVFGKRIFPSFTRLVLTSHVPQLGELGPGLTQSSLQAFLSVTQPLEPDKAKYECY